jgi:hypothetical protein
LAAGFFLPNGYEFVLMLLGSTAGLVAAGAGAFSIDALLAGRLESRSASISPIGAKRAA